VPAWTLFSSLSGFSRSDVSIWGKNMKWLLLLIFGGIGLAALIGGVMWGQKRQSLVRNGVRAQGKVVAQEEGRSPGTKGRVGSYRDASITYNPVVEFVTEAGQTVRFTGSSGGVGKPLIDTGTEVEVIYDPAEPSHAQIASFTQFWLGPLAVAGSGLVFLLMGVGGFFLIGSHDRGMAERITMMNRERLVMRADAQVIQGTIVRIEEKPEKSGRYVFICRALRPFATGFEEFSSDYLPFDPGRRYLGRTVDVRLDPDDRGNYYVDIDPLLREIMSSRER
jgi:hypothetical protein